MKHPPVALISKAMRLLRRDQKIEQKVLAKELSEYRAAVRAGDKYTADLHRQNMQRISRVLRRLHLTSCLVRGVPYRLVESTCSGDNSLVLTDLSAIANMVWVYTGINLNVDRVSDWVARGAQPMLLPEDAIMDEEILNAL